MKVKCINSKMCSFISEGKIYNVLDTIERVITYSKKSVPFYSLDLPYGRHKHYYESTRFVNAIEMPINIKTI